MSGETTYSYTPGNDNYETHNVTTTTMQTYNDVSKNGNTKTVTTYTSTTSTNIVKKKVGNNTTVTEQSRQNIDKTTETYSKNSDGEWVTNGDASTSNIASTQMGEGLVGGNTGNFIDGDRMVVDINDVSHNSSVKDVASFAGGSDFGENILDHGSLFDRIKPFIADGSSYLGAIALAVGQKLKWASNAGKISSVVGAALLADSILESFEMNVEPTVIKNH